MTPLLSIRLLDARTEVGENFVSLLCSHLVTTTNTVRITHSAMKRLQHVDGPTFRKSQLLIQTSRYCTPCTRSHNLGTRLLHAPTSTHPWPQPPPPPNMAGAISSHDAVQTSKTSVPLGNRTWPSCFKDSCH